MDTNGRILRTLNVLKGDRQRLKSLEYAFNDIDHYQFLDSVTYLQKSGYIQLTDTITKNETTLDDSNFNDIHISLTSAGIKLLCGAIQDDCVEV
ncbi:MAG: hypothetical protein ACI35S_02400 [Anaeroplasma sp.]